MVTKVDGFHGVFQDSKAKLTDFRNPKFKVCYKNLIKIEIKELAFILDSALVGQIKCLKKVDNFDKNLLSQLLIFLQKFRQAFKNIFYS